ncbi:MAG: replication factor C large subunit [Candidatus Aenigmarchaeota archaeon]|nr:replication factor C large subunit [Candidatus Aenigmarchaeota archaeon]
MDLWVDKYKPEELSDFLGQPKALQEIADFLREWKPGEALFIHGPAGVGKTLAIELLARERKHLLLQLNASDARNAKDIEGFFGATSVSKALFHGGKIILIDEIDGISPQDRGAVTSIINIIKGSRFPVFLIANDPWKPKLMPLRNYCRLMRFNQIHSASIEKQLKGICEKEGIEAKGDALKNLARWSQGDLRSAISDLQIVAYGKKVLKESDLQILGYRERASNIFSVLPTVFHSKSMTAAKKAIQNTDKDPDEVFWWIETNLPNELRTPENMQKGYDILSKADMFRNWVSRQQNWRFKGFMVDMLSGVSLFRSEEKHSFSPYQPPKKLIMLGRSKQRRAMMDSLCSRLGSFTHSSKRTVKKDYLPYLRIILKKRKKKTEGDFFLESDEEKLIKAG